MGINIRINKPKIVMLLTIPIRPLRMKDDVIRLQYWHSNPKRAVFFIFKYQSQNQLKSQRKS